MQYWDIIIKDLDKDFIDTLASEFDIDYYWCEIDPLMDLSVTNQIIKYIYEKAIDKIVDDAPEEIFENMYYESFSIPWMTNQYHEEIKDSIKETLKDNIFLNYLDSSIDYGSEKLANEYSQELADYIFESWLINY